LQLLVVKVYPVSLFDPHRSKLGVRSSNSMRLSCFLSWFLSWLASAPRTVGGVPGSPALA